MGRRSHSSAGWHEDFAKAVTRRVIQRDGGVCQIGLPGCTIQATQVDHVRPIVNGGSVRDLGNMRAACASCNSKLGGKVGAARRAANA